MKTATMIVLMIPLILLALWLVPLGQIWALNTLFSLGIAYTLKTWAAMLLLSAMVAARVNRK